MVHRSRLSGLHAIRGYYAFYFAAMGLMLPFFPLWLAGRRLDVATIGLLSGLLAAGKVVAPPLAGWLADRHPPGGLRAMVVVALGLSALLALAWPWVDGVVALALLIALFGLLWAATLPLADQLSIALSEQAQGSYGRLRAFGSLGFIVASLAGGAWLGGAGQVALLPPVVALVLLMAAACGAAFPPPAHHAALLAGPTGTPQPARLRALILAGFLMQLSHGTYYGFFTLHLGHLGYTGWQIGFFWMVGVAAEIVLMWRWSDALHAADPYRVLSLCLLLAALRWIGTALAVDWWAIALLQLLHAASYAAFHITALVWVQRWAPAGRSAAAQGWFSSAGFGLGASLGMAGCGQVIAAAGFTTAWWLCAAVALAAIRLLRPLRQAA
ncbi:MAG: MFS transporter [Zetaproteobacteria bacterium]|nr:MAG: MFS transporter [Zetaproteobacteria bacterium]